MNKLHQAARDFAAAELTANHRYDGDNDVVADACQYLKAEVLRFCDDHYRGGYVKELYPGELRDYRATADELYKIVPGAGADGYMPSIRKLVATHAAIAALIGGKL